MTAMSANSTTVGPINNITVTTNGSLTTPSGLNITNQIPWFYPTPIAPSATFYPPGVIITSDYWYWNGLYYFYMVLLLAFGMGLTVAVIARRKRKEMERIARARAQRNGNTSAPPTNPASTGTPITQPQLDNPPTYDNVMANYINAKEQLCAMEEGCTTVGTTTGGTMAMSASTASIATCLTEVTASRTDLNANAADTNAASSETPRPTLQ